jgi:hypothetical protein
MCDISCVLDGEDRVDFEDLKDLSVCDIEYYKYVGLVSCDVERTFSQYKSFLKMSFVTHCNSASLCVWDTDDFWWLLCAIIGTFSKTNFSSF